jgi:hypothetical protein
MNCLFCQQKCTDALSLRIEVTWWHCHHHLPVRVKFCKHNETEWLAVQLVAPYKDKIYQTTSVYGTNSKCKFELRQLEIDEAPDTLIIELNFIPNINPNNLLTRLPYFLTFS